MVLRAQFFAHVCWTPIRSLLTSECVRSVSIFRLRSVIACNGLGKSHPRFLTHFHVEAGWPLLLDYGIGILFFSFGFVLEASGDDFASRGTLAIAFHASETCGGSLSM